MSKIHMFKMDVIKTFLGTILELLLFLVFTQLY